MTGAKVGTVNDHLVGLRPGGANENRVIIAMPPMAPMSREEALRLAAWIVAVADRDGRFEKVLAAVRNT